MNMAQRQVRRSKKILVGNGRESWTTGWCPPQATGWWSASDSGAGDYRLDIGGCLVVAACGRPQPRLMDGGGR